MDGRNRKIEIQIRGIFALILSLNLEQAEEIKAEVEFVRRIFSSHALHVSAINDRFLRS